MGQDEQQLAEGLMGGGRPTGIAALTTTGQGLEGSTHKATFCYISWKATGQGPVVSWGCAVGKEQRSGIDAWIAG